MHIFKQANTRVQTFDIMFLILHMNVCKADIKNIDGNATWELD